ncbi:MAG: phage major capsid protein [Spongiibacteraceae bacterium]|uniref:phage major capsid protein n=1 Tax=uncultured Haliea sp. TaxID=622616 RepID=UPI000C53EDDA|nr:phage major capsid protein [Spongiibacteraceae bacterium]|tara:strand:+ start:19851 stop:21092 length:1242 start_codon:yes stop_codon:yes gene_type:complete
MSKRLQSLREKRSNLVKAARDVIEHAEGESRSSLNSDEQQKYDTIWSEVESLGTEIKREEDLDEAERRMAERASREREEGGNRSDEQGDQSERRAAALMGAFRSWCAEGRIVGQAARELRDLQADVDIEGGYIVPPEQFVNQLIKFVDDMVFIRQRATVIQVPSAQSLGAPSLDTDPADADWTSELDTGSEDSAMAFGKRSLHPHPLAKRIKVSNKLLRVATMSAENLVRERLAYKFGITEEKAFLTGTGAGQPLGLFTASNDGISTGRDVSEGNTATSIKFDGLIEAKYTLKGQYHPNAAWMFHRDALKQLAKLKDGEGQYIWRESVRAGEPDRLLGLPFIMSEYAPNTFTTGKYVGILGDYSNYWIADSLAMQLQRLVELYAETNQVGFIGRRELDGMPVLEEAFVRVKLG